MTDELARLRREAERLGLGALDDDDLEAILEPLERTRKALAESRVEGPSSLVEPPYRFSMEDEAAEGV